jgi:DUF2075 family protein
MIIYKSDAGAFIDAVDDNQITSEITTRYTEILGHKPQKSEENSWTNSLRCMETVIRRSGVPDDCGVLIEYAIGPTNKRIDFVIAGHDESGASNFIIVELKQWSEVGTTYVDDNFITYTGGANREVVHPSYQARSYKLFLEDMNEAVCLNNIKLESCSYLHNYPNEKSALFLAPHFADLVADTPIFFSQDVQKLEDFIKQHVGLGKGMVIVMAIEAGKIRPSKKLVDYVNSIFRGNRAYVLLDEQRIAYSAILKYAESPPKDNPKTTIIINGGPGTGKSVVAVNVLVSLLKSKKNIRFVAPNSAFRTAIVQSLSKGKGVDPHIKALFGGSSAFYDTEPDSYDVLIVDEAHRLKRHGAYMYKGDSQVEDIVRSAVVSVFFVDDTQMIRPDDEGSTARIRESAKKYGSNIKEVHLEAQFRCAGADGFINWVDNTLQIRETANYDGWNGEEFEFKIFDDPNKMYDRIQQLNDSGMKARMLAGYAWDWTNEKDNPDAQADDVVIEECNFSHPWNSRLHSTTWAIDDGLQGQIGCVHTSQGLEFDYVGVIIGYDLRYDPVKKEVYADISEYKDTTGKKGLKNDPDRLTQYVKNIYKVLMSRGMKGCFVFCRDSNLRNYLHSRIYTKNS